MTDFFWPRQLVPSSSSWSLVSNTSVFTSPLSGTTRTLGRSGDRWRCSLTFDNLRDDKRAILQAFLAQLRGQANRVYVVDHAYRQRGSFPTSNLLPDFSSASAWATSYSTLTVADGVGRITAASHSGAQYPEIRRSSITVTNGAAYVLRAFYTRSSTGTASMGPLLGDGTNSTASYATTAGLKSTNAQVMTGTSAYAALVMDSTGTSTVAGDQADIAHASLARCMTVATGSQTGSVLYATNAGTYSGALLAGDRIEVNGEYNMVADAADSGGGVLIRLVRPLRTSPTNGAPVIVADPVCRMMLADNTVSWSNAPGRFSSFTVELVEDLL